MLKKIFISTLIYLGFTLSCKSQEFSNTKVNIHSALEFLDITKSIQLGNNVTDELWNDLFSTLGYKKYFIYSTTDRDKNRLKEVTKIVFDPSRRSELDSLLTIPLQMDGDWQRLMLIKNIHDLSLKTKEAYTFLNNTNFQKLFDDGDSLARAFLPNSIKSKHEALYDIYFIISDPDGRVNEDGILVDLNTAITLPYQELVGLIAHEFHHNYRLLNKPKDEHPLLVELNKIHQEGIADLIDKKVPPLDEMFFYPKSFLDVYNEIFFNTPEILNELERQTLAYINEEITKKEYYSLLNFYFKFGGHPNGYFMSLMIKEELGTEMLIQSYNHPIQFIKLYNRAYLKQNKEPQFSQDFLKYLESLK